MKAWLFLFVFALGGMLLGAIPLLIAVERRPKGGERKQEAYAPASRRRNLALFCLLPLMVYILLWNAVAISLFWDGFLVGGILSAIVAAAALYVGRAESGKGRRCGAP